MMPADLQMITVLLICVPVLVDSGMFASISLLCIAALKTGFTFGYCSCIKVDYVMLIFSQNSSFRQKILI